MRTLTIGLLSLLLSFSGLAAAEDTSGIHVSGRGSVETAPDMGVVTLYVRREGDDAGELKTGLDTVVRAVLKLTTRLAIAARDVQATDISIYPRYRRRDDETVVDGLIASRTISITLRDLDRFGDLLKESLAAGVNNVDPMRLDSSRRAELEVTALELAMADAQAEAARVAAGFSVALGPVQDVHVDDHMPRPMELKTMAMADGGGDISPGVIQIERSVRARFAIRYPAD